MKRNTFRVYLIFSVIVLVGSLTWFAISVFVQRGAAEENAESEAIKIGKVLTSGYLLSESFTEHDFQQQLIERLSRSPLINLVVYSRSDGIELAWLRDEAILVDELGIDTEWSGQPGYDISAFRYLVKTVNLPLPGHDNLFFDAVFESIDRSFLTSRLYVLLVILIVFLVITILLLVFSPDTPRNTVTVDADPEARTKTFPDQAPLTEPSLKREETVESEQAGMVPEPSTPQDSSRSLFSPETGLGWENLLEERLSLELKRAASFDQDLVLALIRCRGCDDPTDKAVVVEHIKKSFTFEDLNFEYKKGFSVIMPDTDLDDGVNHMKQFYEKVAARLKNAGERFSIGLSSRNGRLLSGNRLIQEADRALLKTAESGDSKNRILAFRSDPDRYRDYIARKSRGE